MIEEAILNVHLDLRRFAHVISPSVFVNLAALI